MSEFQARGIAFPRQGARQLRAKLNRFEFNLRSLRAGQLFERRCSNHDRAVPVPTIPMQ
jgi:hypothetical protein